MKIFHRYFKTFLLAVIITTFDFFILKSQTPMVALPSPNAASLGTFGQIPASPFTGVPNINIPLYAAQDCGINIPISLSYHTSLVKPEHVPGWVGLGWSLSPGGSITRISKGTNLYDENNTTHSDFPSYLEKRWLLGDANWYSVTNLERLMAHENNSVGHPSDYEPDEFSFNFGDYSGTFYLHHNGEWKVRSQSPLQLKIVPHTNERTTFPFNAFYTLARYYHAFSIFTEDGTEYLFGNDLAEPLSSDDPVGIEFSVNVTEGSDRDTYGKTLIPTTWQLCKIISPDGQVIEFKYRRGGGLHTVTRFATSTAAMYHYNLAPCDGGIKLFGVRIFKNPCFEASFNHTNFETGKNVQLTYPSYLEEIKLSDNSRIKFQTSVSNQLDYPASDLIEYKPSGFQVGPESSIREKLDNITVLDPEGDLVQRFDFTYTDNNANRLFLDKIQETGRNGEKKKYEFGYDNAIPWPAYNSGSIDHWGYYIGGNYFSDLATMPDTRTVNEVNAPLMQRGILTRIKYPTGGSTKLEYEPHRYASVVNRNPLGIENKESNLLTGGVRVKAIRLFDSNDQLVSEKQYFYVKDFITGGTKSSGVLAGEPAYAEFWDLGVEKLISFSDRIIQPLSYTNGSHITYSEVVERETGNGYKVYKYSNSDNPIFRDREPFYSTQLLDNTKTLLPFSSLDYTRGNLLSEVVYDEAKNLQQEISYEYNNETPIASDQNSIRSVFIRYFIESQLISAHVMYTFCPYLARKTITDFDKNGQNPVSNEIRYRYTNNKQLQSESYKMSDGTNFTTTFKYPLDYSDAESTVEIARMRELHIVNSPIEKLVYKEKFQQKKVLEGEYQQFKEFHADVIKPWKIYKTSFTEPVDFADFNLARRKTVSGQHFSLVVDNCCSNSVSESFTISPLAEGQTRNASLTLHLEIPSPSQGNFAVNLTGPTGLVIQSFTLVGSTVNEIYTIDHTRTLDLIPGDYTIELTSTASSEIEYYGRCDLAVEVLGGFQYLEPRAVFNFDNSGKLIELKANDDFPTSYVWGYNNKSLLVARIINATQDEVFLEDFESFDGANKGVAHTGHFFKNGSFELNFAPTGSKPYKLSYWYLDGNEWKFSGILDYTAPTTIPAQGSAIDGIRVYPANAQVTTYTHDPLIGATSMTDASNITTYYEYDGLNRLIGVKDHESNYLKRYEYHYKQ